MPVTICHWLEKWSFADEFFKYVFVFCLVLIDELLPDMSNQHFDSCWNFQAYTFCFIICVCYMNWFRNFFISIMVINKHLNFTGQNIKSWWAFRNGKSRKHASVACGQFSQKLWTSFDRQHLFYSFYPSIATSLQYWYTINKILFKSTQCTGKNL